MLEPPDLMILNSLNPISVSEMQALIFIVSLLRRRSYFCAKIISKVLNGDIDISVF